MGRTEHLIRLAGKLKGRVIAPSSMPTRFTGHNGARQFRLKPPLGCRSQPKNPRGPCETGYGKGRRHQNPQHPGRPSSVGRAWLPEGRSPNCLSSRPPLRHQRLTDSSLWVIHTPHHRHEKFAGRFLLWRAKKQCCQAVGTTSCRTGRVVSVVWFGGPSRSGTETTPKDRSPVDSPFGAAPLIHRLAPHPKIPHPLFTVPQHRSFHLFRRTVL
jgi:hypothetical protein